MRSPFDMTVRTTPRPPECARSPYQEGSDAMPRAHPLFARFSQTEHVAVLTSNLVGPVGDLFKVESVMPA